MRIFKSRNEAETEKIAELLAENLKGGDVVALKGDLGAGKTFFTKCAVKALGNESDVTSPTFSIVNDYGGNPHIYHFDMYRINGEESLYETGFYDYQSDDGIIFIEWSENVEDFLPDNSIFVEIEKGRNTERTIKIYRAESR